MANTIARARRRQWLLTCVTILSTIYIVVSRRKNAAQLGTVAGTGKVNSSWFPFSQHIFKKRDSVFITRYHRGLNTLWQEPGAVNIFEDVEQLLLTGAVIEDQRSTWQEGSRTPYYLRAFVYQEVLEQPAGFEYGHYLLRVNATFPDYLSEGQVRCRPFTTQSNWPPVKEVIKHHSEHAAGIRIECDLPLSIADEQTGPPPYLDVMLDFQVARYNDTKNIEPLQALHQAEGQHFTIPPEYLSTQKPLQMGFQLSRSEVERSKYTLCAPPFRDYDYFIGSVQPLRFIEWRMHWRKLGVERTVWYAYREEPKWLAFLRSFLNEFDNQDEIVIVDHLYGPTPYNDQNLWLNHCVMHYRHATDYFVIFDLDETVELNPAHYDDPEGNFNKWVDHWKPEAGAYAMLRVDLSMSEDTFRSVKSSPNKGPSVDILAHELWTAVCTDPWLVGRYLRKTIHRAHAVQEMWIHMGPWMYPVPVGENEPLPVHPDHDWPKPYWWGREVWPHEMWHQNVSGSLIYEDLWPRAYHFRWWGGQEKYEIGDLPLPTHPIQTRYVQRLHKEVHSIGKRIARRLDWMESG